MAFVFFANFGRKESPIYAAKDFKKKNETCGSQFYRGSVGLLFGSRLDCLPGLKKGKTVNPKPSSVPKIGIRIKKRA
jgi:hypothetical protein